MTNVWRYAVYRFRNVARFGRIVWDFQRGDYSHLLQLMEVALREMRDQHRDFPITADASECAKQLTIAAELCRRIREDNYFENAGYEFTTWRSLPEAEKLRIAKHAEAMAVNDCAELGKSFRRVRHWWQ